MLCASLLGGSASHASHPAVQEERKTIYLPHGDEGTLMGTIEFKGEAPKPQKIDMYADPACPAINSRPLTEDVLVKDGRLGNVFVYLLESSILDSYAFEMPASPARLEHKGCQYVPRVLGVRVGQTIEFLNSDPTTHNTNMWLTAKNGKLNRSQAPGAAAIEWRFALPETFIKFKDNQHPWETAYVGVFAHPFFATSAPDGSYRIEGLPPGEHTIMAWHEKLGEQKVKLTVKARETKELNFTFEMK